MAFWTSRPQRADVRTALAALAVGTLIFTPLAKAKERRSGFEMPVAIVKREIAQRFACAWVPYLEGSDQCGDEKFVINRSRDGKIESVEFTLVVRAGPAVSSTHPQWVEDVARGRANALWAVKYFAPSWADGAAWVEGIYRKPPDWGKHSQAKAGKITAIAQDESPVDIDLTNVVFGLTRGDPQRWDLPHPAG